MTSGQKNRITDEMMRSQLERAVSYTGIPMLISKWTPGDYRGSRYQLIDETDGSSISVYTTNIVLA